MEEEKCPCCPNHCDVNSLSCGKGREYFKTNIDNITNNQINHIDKDESDMTLEEKSIYKIRKCGHFLHHSKKTVNLNFLSDEEKQNLINILSKCLDNWK